MKRVACSSASIGLSFMHLHFSLRAGEAARPLKRTLTVRPPSFPSSLGLPSLPWSYLPPLLSPLPLFVGRTD